MCVCVCLCNLFIISICFAVLNNKTKQSLCICSLTLSVLIKKYHYKSMKEKEKCTSKSEKKTKKKIQMSMFRLQQLRQHTFRQPNPLFRCVSTNTFFCIIPIILSIVVGNLLDILPLLTIMYHFACQWVLVTLSA